MIMMNLMSTLLKYQFVEKLYPATMAGLEYTCYPSDLGLVFKVSFRSKGLLKTNFIFLKFFFCNLNRTGRRIQSKIAFARRCVQQMLKIAGR